MKIIRRFFLKNKNLLLIRGNMFFAPSAQAYVLTTKLLRKYAKRFDLSYIKFEFFDREYLGFYKSDTPFKKPLREQFIDWILVDPSNLLRAAFHPQIIDGAIIVRGDKMSPFPEPSVVPLDGKSIIFVSEGAQKIVTREEIKDVFLRILMLAYQANLLTISTIPFGQPHLPETIKGMIDAIKEFDCIYPIEIRLFEVNPIIERRIFPSIEGEFLNE